MAPAKHTPQRTCAVCRQQHPKRELTRLVRAADNRVMVDPSGKQAGRGVYLCSEQRCWQQAAETNVIGAALRMTLTEADRQHIRENTRS
jgi:predicted RNA-binding protein YlxR (DUF448 family)